MKPGEWTFLGAVFGGCAVTIVGLLVATTGYILMSTAILLALGVTLLVIGSVCAAFGLWVLCAALVAHYASPDGASTE